MYLTQGLHRALQRHPDKVALRHLGADGERAASFAALVDAVGRRAAALRERGVKAGDRVALLAPNNDGLIVLVWACWWLGATACPLNTRWSLPELRHALADSGAALLAFDPLFATQGDALAAQVPAACLDTLAAQAASLPAVADTRSGGDTLAALLYTGGTTGRPKGVMLTHANFWSAAMARGAELPNPPQGVSLLVAPLFHVAGLARLIGQSIVGGSCITMPNFQPAQVLGAIERHRITDTILVPTMLQALLDLPGFDRSRVQSLNRIAFGAAPMPPDLLDRALAAWPKAEFFQAYGLTETAGSVCINPPANHRGDGRESGLWRSVGRPGLGAEIRVVDEHMHEQPAGTVGEIVVRGPMVMAGDWQQPEASAEAVRDGWLRTGDAGHMDAEGHLTLADRLKDMIISGGENVYSAEVEAVLRLHPAVSEAAVIGRPDARWGESVHAVVVLRATAPKPHGLAEALMAWCRPQLAGYKCPRSVAFVDALPLSAAGKILKTELRHRLAQDPAGVLPVATDARPAA